MSAECVVGVYVGSMKAVAVRAKVEAGGNYRSVSASSRGVSTSAPSPSRIHEASTPAAIITIIHLHCSHQSAGRLLCLHLFIFYISSLYLRDLSCFTFNGCKIDENQDL